MLEKMGLPYNELEKRGIICPVLSIDIEYKSMSRFGETVIIDAKPVSYKGVRFSIEYIVRDKASGEIRCVGKSSHCFVDEGSKPVSLKKTQPDIHEAFLTSIEKENA